MGIRLRSVNLHARTHARNRAPISRYTLIRVAGHPPRVIAPRVKRSGEKGDGDLIALGFCGELTVESRWVTIEFLERESNKGKEIGAFLRVCVCAGRNRSSRPPPSEKLRPRSTRPVHPSWNIKAAYTCRSMRRRIYIGEIKRRSWNWNTCTYKAARLSGGFRLAPRASKLARR